MSIDKVMCIQDAKNEALSKAIPLDRVPVVGSIYTVDEIKTHATFGVWYKLAEMWETNWYHESLFAPVSGEEMEIATSEEVTEKDLIVA